MHKDICWIIFFVMVILLFLLKTVSIRQTFKKVETLHDLAEECLNNLSLDELDKIIKNTNHETMIFNNDTSKIYLDSFEEMISKTGRKPTAQQLQFLKIMKQDITKSSTVELYDNITVVTISKSENNDYCVLKYSFV